MASRAECCGPLEEGVRLDQGGRCLEAGEDLVGLLKCVRGFGGFPECDEAAALAKKGECLLGDDPEPLPAFSGLGIAVYGGLMVAAGLGERGAHRDA